MQSNIAIRAAAAEDDHPCVRRRLHHRRLLAYLHNQGFEAAFHSEIFSVPLLRKLVEGGWWGEALSYLCRFLPLLQVDVEARTLILFLSALRSIASISAARTSYVDVIAAEQHHRCVAMFMPIFRRNTKLSSIVNTMLNSPLYRSSLDWEVVNKEASSIAHDLALESPELSLHDTNMSNKEQRWISSPTPVLGLDTLALNQAADLLEKCLKASKRPVIHQGHPSESTRMQELNQEEWACIRYIQNHCLLNPSTMLVDIVGHRLNAQHLKCLTIDKIHDGTEKFIPTIVTNAYIKIISERRANCVLSNKFLIYDTGRVQDILGIVHGDVSMMQSANILDHAKLLIKSEQVFLPMVVNQHIIVLVVNNKSKEFQVLDSAMAYSRYQSQIDDMVRGIKNLLKIAKSHGLHEVPDVTNWRVNQIYGLPKQEDGCSCSLFALKYIEFWDGKRLSINFDQSHIHSFRVQVLVELLFSDLNGMNDVKNEIRRLMDEAN